MILTQKRLYFLSEARSIAHLLTELKNVLSVEKYQHQPGFSSSKAGIKIYTSSLGPSSSLPRDGQLSVKAKSSSLEKDAKISISLLFKNTNEQDLWHAIIVELWSGLTIANDQCDIVVLNKASRHIALMDVLSNIKYYEEKKSTANAQATEPREKSKQRHYEVISPLLRKELPQAVLTGVALGIHSRETSINLDWRDSLLSTRSSTILTFGTFHP